MPASTESPQWVSLASVSIKESPCDRSHLLHQRLRTQKSPFSGLWWPLAPAVLQGEDPRAKDTQLGSVFHNELYRLRGDLTENFSSKYFSKAGPAHFFSPPPNLYSIKTWGIQEQAPLCRGNTFNRHKIFHCNSYWFRACGLPTRSSAQVGAGGCAKPVGEKQEE